MTPLFFYKDKRDHVLKNLDNFIRRFQMLIQKSLGDYRMLIEMFLSKLPGDFKYYPEPGDFKPEISNVNY